MGWGDDLETFSRALCCMCVVLSNHFLYKLSIEVYVHIEYALFCVETV